MSSAGLPLTAAWVTTGDVRLARWMADLDLSEVWLDLEHGFIDNHMLPGLVTTIRAAGKRCRARVPTVDASLIENLWLLGAEGVVVPHVSSVSDVTAAVQASELLRGAARDWRDLGVPSKRSRPAIGALIEDAEALKAAEAIIASPGLDLVIVGRQDLGRSLGEDPLSERTCAANRSVFELARLHGVATGIGVPRCGWPTVEWKALARSADVVIIGHDYDFVSVGGASRIAALGTDDITQEVTWP